MEIRVALKRAFVMAAIIVLTLLCGTFTASATSTSIPSPSSTAAIVIAQNSQPDEDDPEEGDDSENGDSEDNTSEENNPSEENTPEEGDDQGDDGDGKKRRLIIGGSILAVIGGIVWAWVKRRAKRKAFDLARNVYDEHRQRRQHRDDEPPQNYRP